MYNIINIQKMNKQLLNVLAVSALFTLTATVFTSCNDDDDDENNNPTPEIQPSPKDTSSTSNTDGDSIPEIATAIKKIFILNEGSMNGNNATLDIYYPEKQPTVLEYKAFEKANGEKIGDTGQDIICYGGKLYLSIFGSNYIAKLDLSGKVIEKYSFKEDEGQPRSLAADGSFIYVSTYGGKIAKFDTTSITAPVALVEVGDNPEGIAIKGNYLVVCNSQKDYISDNRISIVDLTSFTLLKHIESDTYSNYQSVAVAGDSVYVTHFTPSYSVEMLNIDIEAGTIKPCGAATKIIGSNDGKLYCANVATEYDENWNATINTSFFVRDTKTGEDSNLLDTSTVPELATATVYMFNIDVETGECYLSTTDYVTNGTVYRFGKDGKFIEKFETSGVNPSKAVIVKD